MLEYEDPIEEEGVVKEDLVLEVIPFHGAPTVYINFDDQGDITNSPEQIDYTFINWEGEQLITITPEMWLMKTPHTKDVFITIGGDEATFILMPYF